MISVQMWNLVNCEKFSSNVLPMPIYYFTNSLTSDFRSFFILFIICWSVLMPICFSMQSIVTFSYAKICCNCSIDRMVMRSSPLTQAIKQKLYSHKLWPKRKNKNLCKIKKERTSASIVRLSKHTMNKSNLK